MTATATLSQRYGGKVDASVYSGLSVRTIEKLIHHGELTRHVVGGRVLVSFKELDRIIAKGAGKTCSRGGFVEPAEETTEGIEDGSN